LSLATNPVALKLVFGVGEVVQTSGTPRIEVVQVSSPMSSPSHRSMVTLVPPNDSQSTRVVVPVNGDNRITNSSAIFGAGIRI
jgi:hypothetical protein